ncbi:hypothetical protein FBR43_04300 [Sphingomonas baiyangensis]|uniref:Uncharacterized protein n=1 Tax=Sphingomonas baiyangensis TaxID=2572576 RepID=A0A4U1L0C6_9SPHN|nr:hypothetical protein FBR43_04300 [Sphingomonas baiyangensis]
MHPAPRTPPAARSAAVIGCGSGASPPGAAMGATPMLGVGDGVGSAVAASMPEADGASAWGSCSVRSIDPQAASASSAGGRQYRISGQRRGGRGVP